MRRDKNTNHFVIVNNLSCASPIVFFIHLVNEVPLLPHAIKLVHSLVGHDISASQINH